jgi:ribonucleoside-triphosphate reductase
MLIRHSYDSRFVQHLQKLKEEYGQKIFDLSGIGENDLDINTYSRNFFTNDNSSVADKTVDGNANVSEKSVLSWENELKKPLMKLNSMYMLWKAAEKKHGIKKANKIIESEIRGSIRIHDFHLWTKPYCWASSLSVLVHNGMPWYKKIKISQVKHFDSLINVSLQYICTLSNSIAGAVALPDFFVFCDYFIRKDYGS